MRQLRTPYCRSELKITNDIELLAEAAVNLDVCIPEPLLHALAEGKLKVLQDDILAFRTVPEKSEEFDSGRQRRYWAMRRSMFRSVGSFSAKEACNSFSAPWVYLMSISISESHTLVTGMNYFQVCSFAAAMTCCFLIFEMTPRSTVPSDKRIQIRTLERVRVIHG